GALPVIATEVDKEELNQPRYWSLPSMYKSAGRLWSSRCSKTASCEEPESNHTSIMSVSFVKTPFRSEEHTSELQSRFDLVCRLLLEKKKHKDRDVIC